jgi:signal transduction histidine kinase
MQNVKQSEALVERLYWLIKLRWIAIAGIVSVVLFAHQILEISLPVFWLYAITFVLGVCNLIFLFLLAGIKKKTYFNPSVIANRVANLQISFDLICLAALIHFSGGIENPFIFYFIFHMIIASILLTRKAAYLQATFTVFLFCSTVMLEYFGIVPHYCLEGLIISNQSVNYVYVAGISFVFISTIYIAVYMATSIVKRLREREGNLREANKLLTDKDRIKSEYVLRVSHDIKEHLAAIQSCIEPVTGGITGSLNEKQKNLLQRADERTGKLLFFVQALLEVTRIKLSKEIKMEHLPFSDILSSVIKNISSKAKQKNISINYMAEASIHKIRGSKEYIQEAILNILANSVKYTPPNGRVDVYVSDKGNSVLIQIKDTGIGIPQDELPKIFNEFYRATNAKKIERDGTGLGLSIAKQVIERHGGKIWVESEQGQGTTFNIILPK